jgi:hypothetical protein
MNPKSKIPEHLIYAAVIILSLIVLGLFVLAPGFLDTQVVYGGF